MQNNFGVFMNKYKQHPLITGTLILTITGLITRIIGFYYRIYLSRLFGEEGMGIYQLINPVLSLSYSLAAAGYQTAISKLVAEETAKRKTASYKPLILGLSISIPLSLLCAAAVYLGSDFIAVSLLSEARTASMLRIVAFSLPLSAVHACINGYFYGRKKTGTPAVAQFMEQCCRVGCVYIISYYATANNSTLSINVAVLGLVIGEFISVIISIISIYLSYCNEHPSFSPLKKLPAGTGYTLQTYRKILVMALPITANRIVLNLLHSVESVSIPSCLRQYGYDNTTALSVYGVLTGMAMPAGVI